MPLPKVSYPTYLTTVPSTGEQVKYRPFTVKEEKILLTALQGEDQTEILSAVNEIINTCYMNTLKVDSLSVYDVEFLFLQLRIKSVSEVVEMEFRNQKCPNENNTPCTKTVLMKIDLSQLKVQENVDGQFVEYVPKNKSSMGTKIMLADKMGVTIKHPGIKEVDRADSVENEYEKQISLITDCITTVFDEESSVSRDEMTKEELIEFVETLTSKQKEELRKFIFNTPKVRHEANFKCKTCGYEEKIVFEGLQSFFG